MHEIHTNVKVLPVDGDLLAMCGDCGRRTLSGPTIGFNVLVEGEPVTHTGGILGTPQPGGHETALFLLSKPQVK